MNRSTTVFIPMALALVLVLATVLYAIPVLLLIGEPDRRAWVGLVAVAWLVYLVAAFPLQRVDGAEL